MPQGEDKEGEGETEEGVVVVVMTAGMLDGVKGTVWTVEAEAAVEAAVGVSAESICISSDPLSSTAFVVVEVVVVVVVVVVVAAAVVAVAVVVVVAVALRG